MRKFRLTVLIAFLLSLAGNAQIKVNNNGQTIIGGEAIPASAPSLWIKGGFNPSPSPAMFDLGTVEQGKIRCEDRDDDGYYFWGIGSKPSTCPSCAPDEPDGDDSDYSVGPMNQYGHCQINTPLVSSPTIIEMSQIWSGTRTVNSDIVIKPGISLTLTGKLNMPVGKHIVVHGCDGELTINGGTLNNANITVKPGGQLKLLNNAKINLNGAELNVEGGGILDDTYGEINCN